MSGEHRAGTVTVRVTADTKGFRRQVEEAARDVKDIEANVVFDPDTARAERAYREWNGREAVVRLDYRPDTSKADPWLKRIEQRQESIRHGFDGLSFRPKADFSRLDDALSSFQRRADETVSGSTLLNPARLSRVLDESETVFRRKAKAFDGLSFMNTDRIGKADPAFVTSMDRQVDRFRERKMDLYKQVRSLVQGNSRLSDDQCAQFERLSTQAVRASRAIRELKGELAKATTEYDKLDKARLNAKSNGESTKALWEQQREAGKRVTALTKELNTQTKALDGLHDAQSSLIDIATDGDAKRVSKMTRRVREFESAIVSADSSLRNFSTARHTALDNGALQSAYKDWTKQIGVRQSSFVKQIEAERSKAEREAENATIDWFRKPLTGDDVARNQFSSQREAVEELVRTYSSARKELEGDVAAMKRNNADWFDLDEYRQTVKLLDEIDSRVEKLRKTRHVDESTSLDGSDFAKRLYEAWGDNGERISYDIHLKYVTDNLEEVKAKTRLLRKQGVDIPITLKAKLRDMTRQLAYYQKRLEKNPNARVKLDVEGDFARLNSQISKWQSQRVEVDFYSKGADAIYREMRELVRSGVEVPVEYVAEFKGLEKQWRAYAKKLESDPDAKVPAELHLNTNRAKEQLAEFRDQRLSVEFYSKGADEVRRTIQELTHKRLDVPVELTAEFDRIESEMRRYAEELKTNPTAEIPAELHLDKSRAEEELRKFREKNDTLDMDVDLETALARAHLAYFTRPRTVDVFANFKGTDIGKILQGMTTGATGVRGVENEFQKLVRLFDEFDTVVPKWSLLGAALTSIGAGALNLARTVGSMGASIVTMSKAALAAPGALLGLSAAFAAGYSAVKNYADYLDVASTGLSGLQTKLADSFWERARRPIVDMMNALAGNGFIDGMRGVASAEGSIAANAAGIVAQGEYMGRVNSILGNTTKAVGQLDPGVQAVVRSMIQLGDATSVYLPRMANYLTRNASAMARWVEEAERNGTIVQAMEQAIEQGGYLKSSVESLGGILSGVFGTLAEGENGIERFADALSRADRAVNGYKFQATLTAWADGAKKASAQFHDSLSEMGDAAYELRDTTSQVFVDAGSLVADAISGVSGMLAKSKTGIADFSGGVSDGFSKLFSAVDSAAPMFDSLLSMVGELSSTFGGTLASTLRAASPTIQAMASGAKAVAEAFNALPAPLQAVVGMYATFGKAGISAWNSLKTGMLENISSTLQYKKMLNDLGVSSKQTAVSMRELVSAMARLKSGQVSGVLSSETAQIRQMGEAADSTRVKISGMNAAVSGTRTDSVALSGGSLTKVGDEAERAGEQIAKASGKLSGLKTVASGVFDFLGGPVGLAIGGVTTAVSLASSAMDTYNSSAEHTSEVNQSVAQSFKRVQGDASDAAASLKEARESVSGNFSDTSYGWNLPSGNALEKIMSGVQQWASPFKDSTKAAKELGVSVNDLTDAATGSNEAYERMHEKLVQLRDDQDWQMGANGQMVNMNATQQQAVERLLGVLEQSHKEWQAGAEAIRDYVTFAGEGSDAISMLTDNTSAYSEAVSMLTSSLAANNYDFERNKTLIDDVGTSAKLSAASMMAYAESKKQNGQATKESAKYEQLAKNAIYEARQEVIQAAVACGQSQEAAERYADSLGLIPDEVSTKLSVDTVQAVSEVSAFLDRLSLTTGQKDCILNLVRSGAITDFTQVQQIIQGLTNGADSKSYGVLLDAYTSGTIDVEKLNDLISKLADGEHRVIVTADGSLAVVTAEELKEKYTKLKDGTYRLRIDAEDATAGAVASAQANIDSVRQSYVPEMTVVDNVSWQALSAKNSVESVPQSWISKLIGSGNTSQTALAAKNSIESVPTTRNSMLNASTTGYDAVSGLANTWNSINSKSVTLEAIVSSKGLANSTNKATGGRIHGPGTGTSDSIPAWLSNGEHVIRAAAVSKLDRTVGPNFLNVLNRTGDLDKAVALARSSYASTAHGLSRMAYASGGRVEKVMEGVYRINVTVPGNDNSSLVSAVNDLRREVADFRNGIGDEIAANSSPWDSRRSFRRDVLGVVNGR